MDSHGSISHRRSIRLKGFDYATPCAYFLTICTLNKNCCLGEIREKQFHPSAIGEMTRKWWYLLPSKFPAVRLDSEVVMPNHLHGILILSNVPVGADQCVRPARLLSKSQIPALSRVVQWFKTMTTNEYLRQIKQGELPRSTGKLWQRNYFEHIIRHPAALENIRTYIEENPSRWALDTENPVGTLLARDPLAEIIKNDIAHPL